MFRKNINGIGLVEIMVAMGLLGVLSLGVMSMMNNANKGVKTTDQNLQIASLFSSTIMIMNDSSSCTSAFAGKTMPAYDEEIPLIEIAVKSTNGNTVQILEKAPKTYNGLTISSIILKNGNPVNWPEGLPNNKNLVTLSLEFQKQAGATFGGPKLKRDIQFVMISDPSSRIIECVSAPISNAKEVCEMIGGTYEVANDPQCHYKKFAVSEDPRDFNDASKYPKSDLGMYVQDGIKSAFTISSTYITPSDRRLKKNIRTIDDALNKTLLLRGVSFEMKKKKFGNSSRIGVIAQEVEKVFPELVMTEANGLKGVEYSNLTAVLIEAIKGQQKQIVELQKKIDNLKGNN